MKIAIIGYKGKSGSQVYETLKEEGYELIGIDKDTISLEEIIETIDLLIDFTNKESSLINIELCLKYKKRFICATTGFNKQELRNIKQKCIDNDVCGVICYNFSIPINCLLKYFDCFNKYFDEITYFDIHHVSKIDKISGTTYLFSLKNDNIKIKSYKTFKNTITYVIQMYSKYDKMIITYQVSDRKVFALGLLSYLKGESQIINLIK